MIGNKIGASDDVRVISRHSLKLNTLGTMLTSPLIIHMREGNIISEILNNYLSLKAYHLTKLLKRVVKKSCVNNNNYYCSKMRNHFLPKTP